MLISLGKSAFLPWGKTQKIGPHSIPAPYNRFWVSGSDICLFFKGWVWCFYLYVKSKTSNSNCEKRANNQAKGFWIYYRGPELNAGFPLRKFTSVLPISADFASKSSLKILKNERITRPKGSGSIIGGRNWMRVFPWGNLHRFCLYLQILHQNQVWKSWKTSE